MSAARSEGMNAFYQSWGPDWIMIPTWAASYCSWLLTPSELAVPATRQLWAAENGVPVRYLIEAEEDKQFCEFRRACEKAAGYTEAHLTEVRRNLYRLASQSNDIRAIRLFLDLMGESPEKRIGVIDVDLVSDEDLDVMLAQRGLDALPPAPTSPEEG